LKVNKNAPEHVIWHWKIQLTDGTGIFGNKCIWNISRVVIFAFSLALLSRRHNSSSYIFLQP